MAKSCFSSTDHFTCQRGTHTKPLSGRFTREEKKPKCTNIIVLIRSPFIHKPRCNFTLLPFTCPTCLLIQWYIACFLLDRHLVRIDKASKTALTPSDIEAGLAASVFACAKENELRSHQHKWKGQWQSTNKRTVLLKVKGKDQL